MRQVPAFTTGIKRPTLCVLMGSALLGPTTSPGPRVHGPPVNTIARAPLPGTQLSSSPTAAPTAAPVALCHRSVKLTTTSSACTSGSVHDRWSVERSLLGMSCAARMLHRGARGNHDPESCSAWAACAGLPTVQAHTAVSTALKQHKRRANNADRDTGCAHAQIHTGGER